MAALWGATGRWSSGLFSRCSGPPNGVPAQPGESRSSPSRRCLRDDLTPYPCAALTRTSPFSSTLRAEVGCVAASRVVSLLRDESGPGLLPRRVKAPSAATGLAPSAAAVIGASIQTTRYTCVSPANVFFRAFLSTRSVLHSTFVFNVHFPPEKKSTRGEAEGNLSGTSEPIDSHRGLYSYFPRHFGKRAAIAAVVLIPHATLQLSRRITYCTYRENKNGAGLTNDPNEPLSRPRTGTIGLARASDQWSRRGAAWRAEVVAGFPSIPLAGAASGARSGAPFDNSDGATPFAKWKGPPRTPIHALRLAADKRRAPSRPNAIASTRNHRRKQLK